MAILTRSAQKMDEPNDKPDLYAYVTLNVQRTDLKINVYGENGYHAVSSL